MDQIIFKITKPEKWAKITLIWTLMLAIATFFLLLFMSDIYRNQFFTGTYRLITMSHEEKIFLYLHCAALLLFYVPALLNAFVCFQMKTKAWIESMILTISTSIIGALPIALLISLPVFDFSVLMIGDILLLFSSAVTILILAIRKTYKILSTPSPKSKYDIFV